MKLRLIKDHVLVTNMEKGQKVLASGIIVPDDDMTDRGVHPRWCQVYDVGPEQKDFKKDEWILVSHGRWSRTFKLNLDGTEKEYFRIDPKDVLLKTNEKPI